MPCERRPELQNRVQIIGACTPGLADKNLRASYAEWLVREEGSKVKRR